MQSIRNQQRRRGERHGVESNQTCSGETHCLSSHVRYVDTRCIIFMYVANNFQVKNIRATLFVDVQEIRQLMRQSCVLHWEEMIITDAIPSELNIIPHRNKSTHFALKIEGCFSTYTLVGCDSTSMKFLGLLQNPPVDYN